jgi:hypothetical protein
MTPPLSPAPIDDEDVAAKKSNEIRIGPITRASLFRSGVLLLRIQV